MQAMELNADTTSLKRYDSVLLDWDGSLARTLDVWLVACREVLQSHGHDVTDRAIGASFGAFPAFLSSLGVQNPEVGMETASRIAMEGLEAVELYLEASDLLEYLSEKDKKMALITSSSREQINPIIKHHNLGRFFLSIVTGDEVTYRKPHPEPLLKAMEDIQAQTSSTIIIGDSSHDILAAHEIGIDSALFFPEDHHKYYDREKLLETNPTYIIADLKDLKHIIS